MPIVNVSLQIIPKAPEEAVYPIVDAVIAMIKARGVAFEVGPMETTMEGEFDVLIDIVKEAHLLAVQEGASRVLSVVKVDYRPNGITMHEKIGKYR